MLPTKKAFKIIPKLGNSTNKEEGKVTSTPFKTNGPRILRPALGFEVEEKPKEEDELITGFAGRKVIRYLTNYV